MNWRSLFRHNHWLTLNISNHQIHVCARCSGTVLGYFSALCLQPLILLTGFGSLTSFLQVIFAFIFALPSGVDWVTQTWGLRLSTNTIRLFVGFLIGNGIYLMNLSSLTYLLKVITLSYLTFATISLGYLGRRYVRTVTFPL